MRRVVSFSLEETFASEVASCGNSSHGSGEVMALVTWSGKTVITLLLPAGHSDR
jgi:hypothetical protein